MMDAGAVVATRMVLGTRTAVTQAMGTRVEAQAATETREVMETKWRWEPER